MPILTWPLAGPDLNAVATMTGVGIVVREGTGQWVTRQVETANSLHLTVSNGDGVAGNMTLDVGANVLVSTGVYADPSWLTTLAWAKLTGVPTTLAGYGITDSIVLTTDSYADPSWLTELAWFKIAGKPTTCVDYGISGGAQLDMLSSLSITALGRAILGCSTPNDVLAALTIAQTVIGYCNSGTPASATFLTK